MDRMIGILAKFNAKRHNNATKYHAPHAIH